MNYLSAVASILLLTSTAVAAAPTVTGNIISWPDDGWYQVQAVTDEAITEVCGGTRSCEVPQGNYIVINHTTGERFNNIVVSAGPSVSDVTVSGNTISWPNDGWYQVQAVTDSGITEVCGGGQMCDVPAGSYIVINHTTGERFEDIVVGDEPAVSEITIVGNTISWPDDGWYQVQSVTDSGIFEVCAGGRSCDVPNGNYIVINHSTSQRFSPIIVSGDVAETSIIRSDTWPDILRNVVTLINADRALVRHEMILDRFASLSRFAVTETFGGDTSAGNTASLGLTLLPAAGSVDVRIVDYSCDAGGFISFDLEPAVAVYNVLTDNCAIGSDFYDGGFSHSGVGREGIFSQMRDVSVSLSDSTQYSLSGALATRFDRIGITAEIQWTDASMSELSGGDDYVVEDYNMRSTVSDGNFPGDSSFTVTYVDGTEGSVRSYEHSAIVIGGFSVSAPWTENQMMQVTTDLELGGSFLVTQSARDLPIPYETTNDPAVYPSTDLSSLPSQWTSGSIDIVAADGSTLSMRPMADDITRAVVDVNGSNEPQQVLWSDGFQVRCYEFRGDFPNCR